MTSQIQTINLISEYLTDILGSNLLGASYGQNNYGISFNDKSILEFCGKCIIMVNNNSINSNIIMGSQLWPLTNIFTGSDNFQLKRYSTISNMNDTDINDLTQYNKYNATMVLPDTGVETVNFDSRICLRTGCQFIAMNFQTFDKYLETYFSVFDEVGFSFILKPCSLRWIPVHYFIDPTDIVMGAGCPTKVTSYGNTMSEN
tara:strand:- start:302 stop:907 length:606 start_codon:yes stop_codon:yes gene_type:complete